MTKTKGPKQMTKIRNDSGEAIPLNNPVEINTSVEYICQNRNQMNSLNGMIYSIKKKIQEFKANIMKISTYTCSNMYNCVATETCVTNTTSFDCHIPMYILVYMNIHLNSSMTINVKINLNKCFIQILCFYCLIKQISQNHLGI